MMVLWQPITNLKDYISNKPPGVTFFLCLLTLAFSFMFLAVYSYSHVLPNPDAKDWNHLLSSIAQYHLCEKNGTSFSQLVETKNKEPNTETKDMFYSTTMAISVSPIQARVPLILSSNSKVSSQSISIHTSFTTSQLQLEGDETFNATIDFTANESYACLTIRGPSVLSISPLPPACPPNVLNKQVSYTEALKEMASAQKCYSLQAIYDPTLQVMLTKEEQLIAIHHLLEVALVLLGVCLILCLSISLTHSPNLHPR